jgi:hypothetical protein
LTTAFVAAARGLKVLVLEKTRYFGGTTAFSGGGAWIPNNKHQAAIGVEDSGEQAETYLREVLGPLYAPTKIRTFLQTGPEMVEWMEEHSVVRFKAVALPDYHVARKGASKGRTLLTAEFDGRELGALIKDVRYPLQGNSAFGTMQADPNELATLTRPFSSLSNLSSAMRKMLRFGIDLVQWGKGTEMANGNALVGRLLASVCDQGVELWKETPALDTVRSNDRVVGVTALRDGRKVTIHAARGVVLATGGFGRSPEAKSIVGHEWSAAPRGNTGDGKRMGVASGGNLPPVNAVNAILAPISLLEPSRGPVRRFPHFAIDRSKPGSIIVAPDGKRFENESAPYQEFVLSMQRLGIKKAFYIADRMHLRAYGMGMALPWPYPIWNLLRQGYLVSAPTIPALADRIGVPREALEQTVNRYNSYAENGEDDEYHRGANAYDRFYGDPSVRPNPNLRPCDRAPFYALPIYPGFVSTLHGLETDVDGRVVGKAGEAITGLYAVGCDQNSLFSGAYPGGGSSIGPAMTFAYRAGRHLASA